MSTAGYGDWEPCKEMLDDIKNLIGFEYIRN